MAYGSTNTGRVAAAVFIPKLWSDEVVASYKGKTVMANLVKNINFKGKKGDTMHLPVPVRGDATAKALNTAVNTIVQTDTEILLVVNQHYEYSKLYEDIAEVQALNSLRSFYTEDAGYALAKRIDRTIHLNAHYFQTGNATASNANLFEGAVIGGDGSTTFAAATATGGNGTALTDVGIRQMIQTLEDQDSDASVFVIPPVEARVLRGISRFTEQAFVGNGDTITTGRLGNVYGVEVFVSSQCPWLHVESTTTATQVVNFSGTALAASSTSDGIFSDITAVDFTSKTDTKWRVCTMMSKEAIALGMQQDIRTQSQYKQEYLGTLVTSDAIFGAKTLRTYGGISAVVPA